MKSTCFLLVTCLFFFPLVLKSQSDPVESKFWEYIKSKNYNEAEGLVQGAIDDFPENYRYYYLRANVSLKIRNPEQALTDISKYMEVFPPNCDAYLMKGESQIMLHKYQDALISFRSALDNSQGMADKQYCYLKIGEALNMQGRYDLALENILKAKGIFSLNIEYLYNMGLVQLNLNKNEELEATKKYLVENHPNRIKTYDFLARYYQKRANYSEALHALKSKIDIDPGNNEDYKLLKKLAIITKDTTSLILASEKLLDQGSQNYKDFVTMAKLYVADKQYAKAMAFINKAIGLKSEDPVCYKIKGDVYLAMNNINKGCDCYFIALKKGFNSTKGIQILEEYMKLCE